MPGLISNDGSFNVTVVNGLTPVGLQANDGSFNVVEAPSPVTAPIGLQHSCGALNVTVAESPVTSLQAADGSLYVSVPPFNTGGARVNPVSGSLGGPVADSTMSIMDDYAVDTGYTLVGANAVKTLNTTNQLQGNGCMNILGHSLNETAGLTKSHGSIAALSDLGVLALLVNRVSDASINSIVFRLTVNAVSEDKTFSNEAQFLKGGRWLAIDATEYTTLTSGTLAVSPRFNQASPFSGQLRLDCLLKKAKGIPTAVLWFEDVNESIIDTAYPLLAARGFKGTCSVPRGFVGDAGKLTLAELKTLYNAGWDMTCNTGEDTALSALSAANAVIEMNAARAYLQDNNLGRAADVGCWPNGTFTQAIADALVTAGFNFMRTTEPQSAYTRYGIPPGVRMTFPSQGYTTATFAANFAARHAECKRRGTTQIYHFHNDITDGGAAVFTAALDELKTDSDAGNVRVLTISQLLARDGSTQPPR